MPIIIHRQDPKLTTGPAPTAANDWDKAVGICVMIAGAFLLIRELTIAGDLAALVAWISGDTTLKSSEKAELWRSIGLFAVRGLALGIFNVLSGWAIWSKAKWAFAFAAVLNVFALIVQMAVLRDYQEEYLGIGLGVTLYGVVRLCGALDSKS